MKTEKLLQNAIYVSLGLSAITVILYVILGLHIRMVADDYCIAYNTRLFNPIEGSINVYQTWEARFAVFFFLYPFASNEPEIMPWLTVISLVMWMLSLSYVLQQGFHYLRLSPSLKYLLPLNIIITFTFYRIMPSYQHAFWFLASLIYVWSIIFALVFVGTILQYFRQPRSKLMLLVLLIWTVPVILVLGGLTETMITLFGILFGLMFLTSILVPIEKRRDLQIFSIVGCASTIIGLIIAIQSPGAAIRREVIAGLGETQSFTPIEALPSGFLYTFSYIFGEFFGVTYGQTYAIAFLTSFFLILFFGITFYLEKHSDVSLPHSLPLGKSFLASIIVGLLTLFAVIYPLVYATSGVLPMRPLVLARFIQLVVVAYWTYLAIVYAQRTNLLNKLRQAKTWGLVLYVVSILLIWSPLVSIYKLVTLYPDYQAYSQSWDDRHDLLSNANPDEIVVVSQLAYDIEDNFVLEKIDDVPTNGVNTCVSNFYDVAGVSEIPEEE